MRILPVLDVLDAMVVRGIAGQRASYRPIQSQLTSESDAVSVCRAFQRHLGITEYYVADLDAIERDIPNYPVLQSILQPQYQLWLDAGFASAEKLASVMERLPLEQLHRIIVGLECCSGIESLQAMQACVTPGQLAFSLDLQQGKPLLPEHASEQWQQASAIDIACQVLELGIQTLIVLDLAAVGMGQGTPTLALCQTLRERYPKMELVTGGGVRDRGDLQALEESGCDGVLIASALHDGRLTRDDLARYL